MLICCLMQMACPPADQSSVETLPSSGPISAPAPSQQERGKQPGHADKTGAHTVGTHTAAPKRTEVLQVKGPSEPKSSHTDAHNPCVPAASSTGDENMEAEILQQQEL